MDIGIRLVFALLFVWWGWTLFNKGGLVRTMTGSMLIGFGLLGAIGTFVG